MRKVATQYRRDLAKAPVNDFLMAHAKRVLASGVVKIPGDDMGVKLEKFADFVAKPPRRGGYRPVRSIETRSAFCCMQHRW